MGARAFGLAVLLAACARGGDTTGGGGQWDAESTVPLPLTPREHGAAVLALPGEGGGGAAATPETLSEAQACAWVLSAIQQRTLELGCSSTVQGCPAMLVLHSGRSCLLYDLERTGLCVEAIGEANVCGDVLELPCAHDLHVPGSAPEGC